MDSESGEQFDKKFQGFPDSARKKGTFYNLAPSMKPKKACFLHKTYLYYTIGKKNLLSYPINNECFKRKE
ncbi:hypothetical protein ACYSNX_12895 [Myroides sp. LJL115]